VLRVGALLLLGGCNVVFPLDQAAVCAHDGLLLCLTFEDNLDDGVARDFSDRRLSAKAGAVEQVERGDELALRLNADSDVVLEYPKLFDLERPYTIDLWVNYNSPLSERPPVLSPTQHGDVVLDYDQQWTIQIGRIAETAPEYIYCSTHAGGMGTGSKAAIPRDGWHHVACVVDAESMEPEHTPEIRLWLDGRMMPFEFGQHVHGESFRGSRAFPRIGAQSISGDFEFTGELDNLRIWNRALSEDELAQFALGED
jgi:hypothetical protein